MLLYAATCRQMLPMPDADITPLMLDARYLLARLRLRCLLMPPLLPALF